MKQFEANDIIIPKEVIRKWQKIINSISEATDTPATLLKVESPYIMVWCTSKSKNKASKINVEESLIKSGLCCENVSKEGERLLISDNYNEKNWNKNINIKLGDTSCLCFPLAWPDGNLFGNICLLDVKNKGRFDKTYKNLILQFIGVVEAHLKLLYEREHLEELVEKRTKNLTDSVEQCRSIIRSSDVEVIFTDREGRPISSSPASESILGYTDKELRNMKYNDISKHGELEENLKLFNELLDGKRDNYQLEKQYRHKNGSIVWADMLVTAVRDGDGEVRYFVTIIKDITEKKQLAEALRESEAALNEAQEVAHIGSWEWDIKADKLKWSDETFRLLGFKPQEFLPKHEDFINSLHPEDREKVMESVNDAMKSNNKSNMTYRIITQSGAVRYIHAQAEVSRDNNGLPANAIGTMLDITDRKSEEDKRAMRYLDQVDVMMVALNTDGTVNYINKAGAKVLGYKVKDIINKDWFDNFLPERFKSEDSNVFKKLMAGETRLVKQYENPVLRSDGEERIVGWSNTLVKDDNGKVIGTLATGKDITDKKRDEETLLLHSKIIPHMSEGVCLVRSKDGIIVYTNPKFEEMFGYETGEMAGKHVAIVNAPTDKDPHETAREIMDVIYKTGEWCGEVNNIKKDGTTFWCYANISVFDHPEFGEVEIAIQTDITERKQAEKRRDFIIQILKILDYEGKSADVIRKIIMLIKRFVGFDAVGIRLREGEDFPYYFTSGFPEKFVQAERDLCERDQNNKLIRDSKGCVSVECMCGNIICGRTDPAKPFFTKGGSFWSSCTSELLATTTEKDRQSHTRNRCNSEGYESVLLVPLKAGAEIVGLLQLNDKRKGMLSLELVEFFEEIASYIGVAIIRKQSEEEILSLSKFPSENPNPVLRISKDGEVLYSNQKGLELLAKWNSKVGEKAPGKWRDLIKKSLKSEKASPEEEEAIKGRIFSFLIGPVKEFGYANLYGHDITELKLAEEEKETALFKLRERVKELNGIFSLSKLTDNATNTTKIFDSFLSDIVPLSMQFPDNTIAAMRYNSTVICRDKDGPRSIDDFACKLTSPITAGGKKCGELMVGYTSKLPFIQIFEQNLIDAYANRLGTVIGNMHSRDTKQALPNQ